MSSSVSKSTTPVNVPNAASAEGLDEKVTRVAIIGAGPAGLLAAILLLRRNLDAASSPGKSKYFVTLVDPGHDYGKLDAEGLKKSRSWMIGLTAHGIDALRQVPDLFEGYVEEHAVRLRSFIYGVGSTIQLPVPCNAKIKECTIDRNFICHALARYLNEHFGPHASEKDDGCLPGFLDVKYHTRALFVDADNQCVMMRGPEDGKGMSSLPYDLLLGCDGIRSVVRNAFLTRHRDFTFDVRGEHATSKSVHVPRPDSVAGSTLFLIADCLPNMFAFVLPETGDVLNLAYTISLDDEIPTELKSDDATVVAKYVKEKLRGLDGIDCDEFGKQWVEQDWSTTGQSHCNFYHSHKLSALLIGDAAHATVPNIGQGMNTALADAAVLNRLLDEHGDDDLPTVLSAFSEERVKEGNALTELSFHSFSLSISAQIMIMIRQNVRRLLNNIFPSWLVSPEPMQEIGRGMKLSEAYDRMHKLGYLARSRRINDDIMRRHFERKVGMIKD